MAQWPLIDRTISAPAAPSLHGGGRRDERGSSADPHGRRLPRPSDAQQLIDRRLREHWAAAGSITAYERALEEAQRILETHVPDPLPDGVAAELAAIVAAAERELGVT